MVNSRRLGAWSWASRRATVGPASSTPPAPMSMSPSERRVIFITVGTRHRCFWFVAALAGPQRTRPPATRIIGERRLFLCRGRGFLWFWRLVLQQRLTAEPNLPGRVDIDDLHQDLLP